MRHVIPAQRLVVDPPALLDPNGRRQGTESPGLVSRGLGPVGLPCAAGSSERSPGGRRPSLPRTSPSLLILGNYCSLGEVCRSAIAIVRRRCPAQPRVWQGELGRPHASGGTSEGYVRNTIFDTTPASLWPAGAQSATANQSCNCVHALNSGVHTPRRSRAAQPRGCHIATLFT